ncbi:hypothetical protein [Mucilaginibacter xinganensis]|uniref:dTDP-4-amino-4,6-dideoxygalactose transaminase n=1 Tax=Mucilaginibacter xinganensis TaxID=1234841 RepID=A0A223NY13_9SPHI|nr:hypothetical protein [Mucilaginibacter xinganensis]ASU34757.1 hypothetical protein MuYL_2870 [Mucilaginibacter xinganensis]
MQKDRTGLESIGGYFELQLTEGEEFYPNLIKLNTGRNALEYILRQKKYKKIYLPYFTCDVLLEPVERLKIARQFYSIDPRLDPIIDFELENDACFLYTNYFGLKSETTQKLGSKIQNLIIDNSQAFFSKPLPGVDTFYSCRKFFGVPDGAYLQINKKSNRKFPVDVSYHRFLHLIKSIDMGVEKGYASFLANNKDLERNNIKTMSYLTQKILAGIDYKECARIRKRNFNFLHEHLKEHNLFKFSSNGHHSPMVYPFLTNDRQLHLHLIQKRIYVPTYWPNVFEWTDATMFENYLARCLVPLPIDHRYSLQDMLFMLNTLKQFL